MIPRVGETVRADKRYTRRPGIYAILPRDGRILLTHQAEPEPEFQLPGGGIDFGEHPEAGMIREVKEETGLEATSLGLLGVDSITRERDEHEFHSGTNECASS